MKGMREKQKERERERKRKKKRGREKDRDKICYTKSSHIQNNPALAHFKGPGDFMPYYHVPYYHVPYYHVPSILKKNPENIEVW